MLRLDLLIALGLACAIVAPSAQAAAPEIASPGPLARPHEALGGIRNCTVCHTAGRQLSAEACLLCHVELKRRITTGRGLHGRMPAAERASCNSCHHEHEGADFHLVEWAPSKERFDHGKTGWRLKGRHATQKCATCHEPRRIVDADAQALKSRGAETQLGLSTRCASCHFDEHRGQLAEQCEQCHGETSFQTAPRFDHAQTRFSLLGKHQAVACQKCHPDNRDAGSRAAFPAPRGPSFAVYSGIEHDRCSACHRDPHSGRFGGNCESCHSVDGWKLIRTTPHERAFHDKTRFPLQGRHAAVGCALCHGPFPGVPARFKGLAFGKCSDCHFDAHGGQLRAPACERCHSVDGFRPARFEFEDHQRSAYPLLGAHTAVACSRCHPNAQPKPLAPRPVTRPRVPARADRIIDVPAAPRLATFMLRPPGTGDGCDRCHADRHVGQLPRADGCRHCHDVQSFRKVRFDHAESRFRLTGAHVRVACEGCHRSEIVGEAIAVRYRPIDTACATCHADIHLGQFGATGCDRCHDTERFAKTRFDHNKGGFTTFPLDGRHEKTPCASCHKPIPLPGGRVVRRYRPLPRDCEACHADFHRGAFRGFDTTAMLVAPAGEPATAGTKPPPPVAPRASASPGETRCGPCHSAQGWGEVRFAHEKTSFPLGGAHRRVTCKACHPNSFTARVSDRCAGCHRDGHAGEFGKRCEGCHDEESWRTSFSVDAHRATSFPLSGSHALIPCAECHPQARDRNFARSPVACVACHQADYQRAAATAIDHAAAGFSTECRTCHSSTRFSPARYPDHERCFSLAGGSHAGIRCLACHTGRPSAQTLGTCSTNSAACTRCHARARTDAQHAAGAVAGYDYQDRKCYECHQYR